MLLVGDHMVMVQLEFRNILEIPEKPTNKLEGMTPKEAVLRP
jgi:hypothetical protein